jgi:HK97 family phage prohead protease
MPMGEKKYKAYPLKIKEVNEKEGIVTGYASVYDVVDYGRDMVKKGAFTKTLREKPVVPMYWGHLYDQPLGFMDLKDDAKGLIATAEFNMAVSKAREIFSVIDQGYRKGYKAGMSIGYRTVLDEKATINDETVYVLKELAVEEVSMTNMPMNPAALMTGIKDYQHQFLVWAIKEAKRLNIKELDEIIETHSLRDGPVKATQIPEPIKSLDFIELLKSKIRSLENGK